ncbi:2-oxoisovalerate dehydrogenase E2 component (dihydrolipoyl transacylase) [Paragonimus westermani]|uniref:Dihydrolipoamide acetyltransferase component of pyruvate dehydrogenase complex n=1 Tax=Paragonimus westermani TaxID=34504 RepID=A0A5J4NET1_9TREM|nr:2-oxoisovalerate dehydrogenase E2 component (dihydrolipoyl transacylase) [Paragonimus westermani]
MSTGALLGARLAACVLSKRVLLTTVSRERCGLHSPITLSSSYHHFQNIRAFHLSKSPLEQSVKRSGHPQLRCNRKRVPLGYVKVGDSVRQFDPICEVQSDKATVTITSRYDGTVRALHFEPQDTCAVGQALVDIELAGDTSEKPVSSATPSTETLSEPAAESPQLTDKETEDFGKVLATPSVRRLAIENKIKISEVVGTGKGGRILKEDVLNFMSGTSAPSPAERRETPVQPAAPVVRPRTVPAGEDKVVDLTVIQRAMKTSMSQSNQIPHFVLSDELDLTRLVELREESSKLVKDRYGLKLTYMPFFIKAASRALLEFPMLNAYTDEECEQIIYKASHNIGIAMDTPEGLLVPNIKCVEQLSVVEIASELVRLQDLGSRGKLGTADLNGGTITLSNIGSIGGTYTAPRILPPQVLIAGLGRIQASHDIMPCAYAFKGCFNRSFIVGLSFDFIIWTSYTCVTCHCPPKQPRLTKRLPRFNVDNSIRVGHILNVSWAADHRIIDGATVTRFCKLWRSYLENPATLVLELK